MITRGYVCTQKLCTTGSGRIRGGTAHSAHPYPAARYVCLRRNTRLDVLVLVGSHWVSTFVYCPEALYTGSCNTPNCLLKHNATFCSLCAVICSSPAVHHAHVNGRQHKSNLSATSSARLTCSVCDVPISGDNNWIQHLSGAPHRNAALRKHVSPTVLPLDATLPDSYRCLVCKKAVHHNNWRAHLRSGLHTRLVQVATQRSRLERAERDRNGVTISHSEKGVDFGVVSRANAQKGVQLEVTVTTNVSSSSISVVRAEVSPASGPNP